MNATEKQIKALSWHLWQNDANFTQEIGQKIKELDVKTASDVIGMFKDEHEEMALNQLRHLGIDV